MEDVVSFRKREQGEAPQREYKSTETIETEETPAIEESKSKGFFEKFKF